MKKQMSKSITDADLIKFFDDLTTYVKKLEKKQTKLMENKQTTVEWLIEQLWAPSRGIPSYIIEQAKQMEKEQHEQTWNAAHQAGRFEGKGIAEENWQTFRQYYNETYNK